MYFMLQKRVRILLKISFHVLCVFMLFSTFLMVFHKLWGKRGILHGKAFSIFLMVLSLQVNHTHQDPTV